MKPLSTPSLNKVIKTLSYCNTLNQNAWTQITAIGIGVISGELLD
jgi:hypothetical protein